jgi:RNA recognition motif-containing protein
MNIFVAKLSPSTTSEDLQELFEEYGQVSSSKVIIDKYTGNSKGYGFVEMDNEEEGQKAIDALDQSVFDDSTIVVQKAKPRR